jgi:hypothetical protein
MTKLFSLLSITLILGTCQQPETIKIQNQSPKTPLPTSTETLNGFSQVDAQTMVTEFCDNTKKYANPTYTEFLVTITEVTSMLNLLNKEVTSPVTVQTANGPKQVSPDGIRIYFANDIGTGTSVSSNDVVIVSTYQGDWYTASNGDKVRQHVDYFVHSNTSGLIGKITHDTDSKNGAGLFDPCTNCSSVGCAGRITDQNHDISQYDGTKMVANFNSQAINSRAAWFNLDQLKQVLTDMNTYNEDGLRIYFARHYKTGDQYKGECSFVVIPTKKGIDYYGCSKTTFRLFEGFLSPPNDNGELCPIYCTGLTLGHEL